LQIKRVQGLQQVVDVSIGVPWRLAVRCTVSSEINRNDEESLTRDALPKRLEDASVLCDSVDTHDRFRVPRSPTSRV
jgi:hypothetical protein